MRALLPEATLSSSIDSALSSSGRVVDHIEERDLLVLVYRQMRLLAGPHPDLDDLVQNALLQVLRANFEGRSKLTTFTHGVCYRVWLKHLRFRFRYGLRFTAGQEEDESGQTLVFSEQCQLEDRERCLRLYRELDRLSARQRAVLSLHELSELSIAEVATIVDASEATVRTRLRDARRRLAQLLAGDPYFDRAASTSATNKPSSTRRGEQIGEGDLPHE